MIYSKSKEEILKSSEQHDLGSLLLKLSKSQWETMQFQWNQSHEPYTVDSLYLDYSLSRTSLYFEQKARSLGHLCTLQAIFISLSRTSLSRIFLHLEQKSWSLATISLSMSNFYPSKRPFTQQIEQKCSIFEYSNVIKTFEI